MLQDLLFRIRATGDTAAAFGKVKAEATSAKAAIAGVAMEARGLSAILGIGFGAATFLALARSVRETIGEVGDLADAAQRAGVSAEELQVLRYMLEQTVGDASEADAGLQKFNVSIGQAANTAKGAAADAFEALGVKIRTAGGALRDNESILKDTFDALAAIEDPARRAAFATQLFGRQAGPAFAAALAGGTGAVEGFRKQMEENDLLIRNRAVQTLDTLDDRLKRLAQRFDTTKKAAIAFAGEGVLAYTQQIDDATAATEDFINNPSVGTFLYMMVGDYAGALAYLGVPVNRPNRSGKSDRLEVTQQTPSGIDPPPEPPPPPAKIDASTAALTTFNDTLDTTKESLSDAADMAKDFVSTFLHDLKDGASLLDAVGNAADRLNDRLLDMAIDQIFGGFGGFSGFGAPMDIRPLPARAGGGPVDAFKPYLVGEAGPEIFVPGRSGGIVPNGGGIGGASVTIIDQRSAAAPPIEQRRSRGADGREHLTMIIRDVVAGPDVSRDLETKYGLRRQLTRR